MVVDSVAALVPRAEIEGEIGDTTVGLQARLMSQALRKLAGSLSKSNTTCIFINQLREKIGVMFGNPETTTGGRALKFFSSVRIDIRRIDSIKKDGEIAGNRVRAKVVKNKVAPPFTPGRVRPHVRRGHLARGLHRRHGRGGRRGQEERRLVHLRRGTPGPRAARRRSRRSRRIPTCARRLSSKVREAFEIPVITRTADEADALSPVAKPAKKK